MSPLDREVEAYRRKRDATLRPILEPLARAGLRDDRLVLAAGACGGAGSLAPQVARILADRARSARRLQ